MAWVLTADDRLIELGSSGGGIGTEVNHGSAQPGIVVGLGGGSTPGKDMAAMVPNSSDLQSIIQFARQLGSRLTRHANFARHFSDHKELLERATSKVFTRDSQGETAFLRELGNLISSGQLKAVGIVTLGKNQRMAYAYQGQVGAMPLTAVVFPSAEWNTLLTSGGKTEAFFFQMRFDKDFPFPFLAPNASGGFGRQYL